jgi:hypothetical protein
MRLRLYENYRFVLYAPFYAAHAIGAYAAEGVIVELLPSPGAGLAEQALLDGTVEVLWAGPMRVMKHHDMNPDSTLVCFAEVVCRDPFSIVGRYPNPGFRLADLADMRIATVSEVATPWLCLQEDLRQAGIDPARLDRIADRSMAENLNALSEGRIEAAQFFEPIVEEALASAGVTYGTQRARAAAPVTRLSSRPGTGSFAMSSPYCAWSGRFSGPCIGSMPNLPRRLPRRSPRSSRRSISACWPPHSPATSRSRYGDTIRFFPRRALIVCGDVSCRAGLSVCRRHTQRAWTIVSRCES